ncbi:hypothetical protein [Rahnella sp. PCH160]|uniref:hypothetical protein n=1 Tax=Rahnella sp. PCH160 TaxID=3447928 RepID=UPI0039FC183C
MPITRIQGAAIPHIYLPNNAQKQSAYNVIAQLQYADLWRAPGQLRTNGVMRVDMQGHIPGAVTQYNIQVQVNGINGQSTVAHVIVSGSLQTGNAQNQQGALNAVIAGLNQSIDTGCTFTVAGSVP